MTEVGYVLTVIPAAGIVGVPGTTKAALEEGVWMIHGIWCLGRLFQAPSGRSGTKSLLVGQMTVDDL